MKSFFTLGYWFNSRPGNLESSAQNSLIILLCLLAASLVWIFFSRRNKRGGLYSQVQDSYQSFAATNLIIGLLLLFFTYELVPFLSSRILFLLWGVGILIWAGLIIKKVVEVPKIKEEKQKVSEFKKYIP